MIEIESILRRLLAQYQSKRHRQHLHIEAKKSSGEI